MSRFYNTKYDWEILATDGHVRGHRLNFSSFLFKNRIKTVKFLAYLLAFIAGTGIVSMTPVPAMVSRHFQADPAHFSSVPGVDKKVSYQLMWARNLPSEDGLTSQQYKDLIASAQADFQAHQDDAKAYEAIGRLNPKPLLTRPEKALEQGRETRADGSVSSNADMLKNGIVTVPDTKQSPFAFAVLASVSGKLSFAEFGAFGQCQFYGEKVDHCREMKTPDQLLWFKPGYMTGIDKPGFAEPIDFSPAEDKNFNSSQFINLLNKKIEEGKNNRGGN